MLMILVTLATPTVLLLVIICWHTNSEVSESINASKAHLILREAIKAANRRNLIN